VKEPRGRVPVHLTMEDSPATLDLTRAILDLLSERAPEATICPSEAARAVAPDDWRPPMPGAREAAAELADQGRLEVLQGGNQVDPRQARGPVRLRLVGDTPRRAQAPGNT
jgi:Protein of unknown function (DUF3253)